MTAPSPVDTAPDSSKPTRGWVWHSTDASIVAGQISVLSVVETFCALGLYGWLAFQFDHQWWLLISAVAAPLILLRSPESKTLGVQWFGNYWKNQGRGWEGFSLIEKVLYIGIPFVVTVLLTLWLASLWLPGHEGWWAFHWRLFALVEVLFTCLVAIAITGSGQSADTFEAAFAFSNNKHKWWQRSYDIVLLTLFTPPFAAAIWLRSLLIRVFATVLHPVAGLHHLPKNCWETLAIVDFIHPPELLPGAAQISDELSVRGLLEKRQTTTGDSRLYSTILVIIWYPPSVMWRWSLKATVWLWFPVALLLRSPFSGKSVEQVRDITAIRVVVNKWQGGLALLGVLLLTANYIPDIKAWVDILGDSISKPFTKLAEFQLPPPGLRQWALWLCCGLAGLEWLSLVLLQAQHKKLLEEEDAIYCGIPETRLATFLNRAHKLERFHTALVVSFILLGYTFALHLANEWYPQELAPFIPIWLLGWL